jgi:hypothetical protein
LTTNPGRVGDLHPGLPELVDEREHALPHVVGHPVRDNHIDEVHPRDGVEHVQADEAPSQTRQRAQLGDRQRRRRRGQQRLRTDDRAEPRKELDLRVELLDDRLDGNRRVCQVSEIRRHPDRVRRSVLAHALEEPINP